MASSAKVPVPAPLIISQAMPSRSSASSVVRTAFAALRDRALAFRQARQMLRSAVVGLQAAESQSRRIGYVTREIACRCCPAATPQRCMPTSISTSAPNSTPNSVAARDAASTCSVASKQSAMVASAANAASRRSFVHADDLVADQNVAHAAAHQGLGLADLLAALARLRRQRSASAQWSGTCASWHAGAAARRPNRRNSASL